MSRAQHEEQEGDALVARFDALIVRLQGLPEIAMRRAVIEEALRPAGPREAVWHLSQLLRGALAGRTPHIDAQLALSLWLVELQREGRAHDVFPPWFEQAHEEGREDVLQLLRQPPPARALAEGGRLPEVRLPLERDVTLGERRSLAAGPDRRWLERLLMDPHQLVLERLLENPALQESDVIQVASRRPTLPALIESITRSERWMRQPNVREAIVLNPYAPTGIALKLLPTLTLPVLRRVSHAGDVHELTGRFAKLLVALSPLSRV